METLFSSYKDQLFSQIQEEYGKLVYTFTAHMYNAKDIRTTNRRFKWMQIILSAISTVGIAGDAFLGSMVGKYASVICSCALLITSIYLKDKEFSSEMAAHFETANALWLWRERYLSLLTDFYVLDENEIRKRRDTLIDETAKIYQVAPLTNEKSYQKAQTALKNKGEQYFTQEELNKLLPQHLRR